jgi:hypothetical protein
MVQNNRVLAQFVEAFMFNKSKIPLILAAVLAVMTAQNAFAKTVNLYDQPQTNSKVVGTIDSESQMVPIFSSKAGDWMKVGNPKNGDVGWLKVSDVNSGKNSGFSFTQQTISTDDGPKTTIQFGVPQQMTPDEVKKMQERQAEVQKSVQKMMSDVYRDVSAQMNNPATYPNGVVPVVVPMFFVASPQSIQPKKIVAPSKLTTPAPVSSNPNLPPQPVNQVTPPAPDLTTPGTK